jgi:hypothetical protein
VVASECSQGVFDGGKSFLNDSNGSPYVISFVCMGDGGSGPSVLTVASIQNLQVALWKKVFSE